MLIRSLPNIITILRIAAVPVTVWFILEGKLNWAFWLFVAAGISDALDGAIARSFSARTRLGGYLDPVADKALLVGVFLALGWEGLVPTWLVILIVLRDIIIVGGVTALMAMKERLAMQPLVIGKINTFLQIAVAALVLSVYGPGFGLDFWIQPAFYLAGLTTFASLAAYSMRGVLILRTRDPLGTEHGK